MNYQKIYDNLINRARNRPDPGSFDKHHVIPRCVGGPENPTNIVKLTRREHKFAHMILPKLYPNSIGLKVAVTLFCGKRKYQECWNKGKTGIYSEETLKKFKTMHLGRKLSKEHKDLISKNSTKKRKVKVFEAICIQFRKRNRPSIYEKGKLITEYNSTIEASKFLKMTYQRVNQVLTGKRSQAKGFILEYGD